MHAVPVRARAELPWRAFRARPWSGGWLVGSADRELAVLDRALGTIEIVALPRRPDDFGAMPVTVADAAGLRTDRWSVDGRFLALHHRDDGTLWSAEARGGAIVLAVRDAATGRALREAPLADPFGGSAVMLGPARRAADVIAWVAAGQDGQAAFLVTERDGAIAFAELPPRDRLPPELLPAGDAYLSGGDDVLELRSFPRGDEIGEIPWPIDEDDPDPILAGSDVIALPGGYAAWSSAEAQLYLVDLAAMWVVDELDLGPGFQYAVRGGDAILSVHADRTLVVTSAEDWVPRASA